MWNNHILVYLSTACILMARTLNVMCYLAEWQLTATTKIHLPLWLSCNPVTVSSFHFQINLHLIILFIANFRSICLEICILYLKFKRIYVLKYETYLVLMDLLFMLSKAWITEICIRKIEISVTKDIVMHAVCVIMISWTRWSLVMQRTGSSLDQKGLVSYWHQAISWTIDIQISIWNLRKKLQWNFNQNTIIVIEEDSFGNVGKMSAILFRPQCMK